MAEPDLIRGRVVRLRSAYYEVETDQGIITSSIRGKVKRLARDGEQAALGDWVEISLHDNGKGIIEAILPREKVLGRAVPSSRGDYQQVLVANLDQLVIVFASALPEPSLRMLDRFLVIAERNAIPALIVANKIDLLGLRVAKQQFGMYTDLGYPVIYTSVLKKKGITELQRELVGKTSALAGPSGVGKTSLLNAIQPELGLQVGEISAFNQKGRHTTVIRKLFKLNAGGYVADLPGLRQLALWDIAGEELDAYFPELRELVANCQFSDCTHVNEPGCAVLDALERGEIYPERYESYLRIRYSDDWKDTVEP